VNSDISGASIDSAGEHPDVAVVILTFNEEENLPQALQSVVGWARQVFVLDSYSTDRTLEIARQYHCIVVQNRFEGYGKQRNFAIRNLPIDCEWVFFLDADEWLPGKLRGEVTEVIAHHPAENGFYIKRRLIWMGKWVRRGYYPTWVLRLFRHKHARCENREINEHMVVEGATGHLRNDFMHEDRKGIGDWITKHNAYATREALAFLKKDRTAELSARFWGSQAERNRWLRNHLWNHLPPLLRPFLYFCYRYVLRGGFLDGRAGLTYHFLQALWFQVLIDIKYLELKAQQLRGLPPV
jgi:glycosyltransferase involved in cell wall biosynthesis